MSNKHNELFLPGMKNGRLELDLSKIEVEVLLEILAFASSAATLVAKEEEKSGANLHLKRMYQIIADSNELSKIVISALKAGKPEKPEDIH